MALVCAALLAPLVERWSMPLLFAKFLANAIFLAVFELAFLLWLGTKRAGRSTLKGVVLYREAVPWWQFVLLVAGLLVWGLAISSLAGPFSAALRDGVFVWMPRVFTVDSAALDPGAFSRGFSRGTLALTVGFGLFFTGIAIPIAEEFYYRGFLLPRTTRWGWWAPLVNVLLWAVNHFFEPWNIPLFILIFLPVAYVAYWKKNIYIGTVGHIIANLMAVLPMLAWLR
jgi:membrane protease YdiL (CAAX protease family)